MSSSIVCKPVPLCFNPYVWLDGNDPSGNQIKPSDNSSQGTWIDKSGRGNHFTQTTGTSQPVFISSSLNSKSAISFNGSQFMKGPLLSSLFSYTMFTVHRSIDTANPQVVFSNGVTSANGQTMVAVAFVSTFKAGYLYGGKGWGQSTAAVNTNWSVSSLNCASNGGTTTYKVNNVTTTTSNPTLVQNAGATNSYIGMNENNSWGLNGTIAEVLYFNYAMTTAQSDTVYNYLANKWGL